MKIQAAQRISGNYTNGITIWNFVGTVTSIRNDTAGGGFADATIELLKFEMVSSDLSRFDTDRELLTITLDGQHNLDDSRYSNIEIENGTTTKIN